jgi:phosphosulfolactate phosphohydrolase-like enzyme
MQVGGGSVKTVQRGVLNMAALSTATQTIAAVNTLKSTVSIVGASWNGGSSLTDITIRGYLTNSTTLTFDRGSATNGCNVSWEVVEFY